MATEAQTLTYSSLLADVVSYLERTDALFVNEIPRFILYAEKEIAAELKTLWEQQVVNTPLLANTPSFNFPARLRRVVSLTINGEPLYERSAEYNLLMNQELPPQQPLYWGYYDYNNCIVSPLPDVRYTLQLIYQEQVQALSPENQENLLTREFPQLLFYGTMYQAALWEKNPNRQQQWQAMYAQALQAAKQEDAQRVVDRNTTTSPLGV